MQIDWANAVIDMAISEPKPAKVQNNLVPSVQYYSNQQFQQSALTPFVTNTFFMTRWLEASFEKNTYLHSIFAVLPIT